MIPMTPELKIVLAIDTSVGACSVALAIADDPAASVARIVPMERGQAEALVPLIQTILDEAGRRPADIDAVAVTIGPGSFTGLRVGLATAKGLGLAIRCPVFGVTTLELLADTALDTHPDATVRVLIDTKRGDAYVQDFQGRDAKGCPVALNAPSVQAVRLSAETMVLINGLEPEEPNRTIYPDPTRLARLVRLSRVPVPAAPLYLRAADATPAPNGGRLWA